ncbi:unnamed protein product [Cylicocyclus nassatus]|uniref:Transmembrane protein 144 n=1 Tax=Cylicocyclus nassatus TaxID=53992 RepID=A0AA36M952_CYLNA|nr:unnamed protein product [Cylicocyclus nassatus]
MGPQEQHQIFGLVSALLATLLYGSCYVPVRWFEAGDGVYFQWLMCIGQLIDSVAVQAFYGWPPMFPLAMLGGFFFALGNALTMPIMNGIGMAVGSLLWNTLTCIVGWGVSRFGLFGSPKKVPLDNVMNVVGIIVVFIGGFFFATLKHHPVKVRPAPWQRPSLPFNADLKGEQEISKTKRILAILCTVIVGCMYGNMLTPIGYLSMHAHDGLLKHYATYFFSWCIGAFLTSTVIFMFYSGFRKNRPLINPELTLPSLLAGLMYGGASFYFFLANEHLDPIVAYPFLTKAPGIVCAMWAVFLFKEIRGSWDMTHLFVGILVTVAGLTMITLSKVTSFDYTWFEKVQVWVFMRS